MDFEAHNTKFIAQSICTGIPVVAYLILYISTAPFFRGAENGDIATVLYMPAHLGLAAIGGFLFFSAFIGYLVTSGMYVSSYLSIYKSDKTKLRLRDHTLFSVTLLMVVAFTYSIIS